MTQQATLTPRRKVIAGGIAGIVVTLGVLIFNNYVIADENKKLTSEVSAALTTVLSFAFSYLIPPGSDEITTGEGKSGITK